MLYSEALMSVSYFNDLHGKAIRKYTYMYIYIYMCVCVYVSFLSFFILIDLAILTYQSLENLVTT